MKPFHELTEEEWEELKKQNLTWKEVRERHPGPKWCSEGFIAVDPFGCWSLIAIGKDYRITKESDCINCGLYRRQKST